MSSKIHVVTGNQTPRDISEQYTGSPERVSELVAANPEWAQVRAAGVVGNPVTFDPSFWRDGVHVKIPESWNGAGDVGQPAPGTVGQDPALDEGLVDEDEILAGGGTCSNGVISNVKEYRYELQEDDYAGLGALAEKWGLPARKWLEMSKANHNIPHKKYGAGVCEPDRTKLWAGRLLKVPMSWPDPPESLWDRLKNPDSTPYTPGGGDGPGPGGEGGEGIDPAKWYGTDGEGGWIWPLLIVAGAGLAGAIVVGASKKKK